MFPSKSSLIWFFVQTRLQNQKNGRFTQRNSSSGYSHLEPRQPTLEPTISAVVISKQSAVVPSSCKVDRSLRCPTEISANKAKRSRRARTINLNVIVLQIREISATLSRQALFLCKHGGIQRPKTSSFLNLVDPPFTFFSLALFLPAYWTLKFFLCTLKSIFAENLAGKVVLITGASSGIGEHLAYEYGKRGARLALSARRENSLREVADRARDFGSPDVIIISADVSKVEDCSRMVDETVNHFGSLDHLVNNAAVTTSKLFQEETDITNFRPIMETNFWGSVYTTRFALQHLKNSRGKIVVMSSAYAWMPAPRRNVYCASKAALISMYETLRAEVGSDISITIVTPGYIESEITKGKYLMGEAWEEIDQDLRDVEISAVPVGSASGCARAIVKSVARGDRYLTVPGWFGMSYVVKVLCPELVEWGLRLMHMSGDSAKEAYGKKILDTSGGKNVLYPSSIQNPDVKTD